ncbi:DNA helicase [Ranunculus cassubicifolius]
MFINACLPQILLYNKEPPMRCGGKGCKRNYHCYCLDPPLKAAPLGVWHCFQCIKKKIQFGVYSVSEGIESICDVREEGVPDCEEIQKQYLVKYEGLAHAHNRWIPEDQLFHEVPSLVAKFKKNQALKWKPEWMRPQRLVQKRSLMTPNQGSGSFGDCQYEWYVKWSGLGYEHATWELENAPFLKSPEAIPLIKDYETRLENALRASDPSTRKVLIYPRLVLKFIFFLQFCLHIFVIFF